MGLRQEGTRCQQVRDRTVSSFASCSPASVPRPHLGRRGGFPRRASLERSGLGWELGVKQTCFQCQPQRYTLDILCNFSFLTC